MKTTIAIAAFAALFLPSCVSTKNVLLSTGDRAAMCGKTVTSTKRNMPSFGVLTPGAMAAASLTGAIGGALVGSVVESKGREQIVKHQLPVPEDTITRDLMKDLVCRHRMKSLPSSSGTVKSEKPESIATHYGEVTKRDTPFLESFSRQFQGVG